MATTQYIGARYVPLFAEPIEWDKTKQYEPLTIVTHEGNSYTSRQFVPTGIEITNETFWALTGNYNAQIEQYRKEVKAYDGRITTAQTTADNAKSLAETNENNIAANDAELAGTSDSGLKTLITNEVSRATNAETEIETRIDTTDTNVENLDAQMAATTGSELLNKITNTSNSLKYGFRNTDKIVVFSDSTFQTNPDPITSKQQKSVCDWIAELCGATIDNRGVCGTSISYLLNQLNQMNDNELADATVAIVAYGTNDWQGSTSLLKVLSTQTDTFDYMYDKVLSLLAKKAPNANIICVAAAFLHSNKASGGVLNVNGTGNSLRAYNDVIQQKAAQHGCACLRLDQLLGINETNYKNRMVVSTDDIWVHYNEETNRRIATALCSGVYNCMNDSASFRGIDVTPPDWYNNSTIETVYNIGPKNFLCIENELTLRASGLMPGERYTLAFLLGAMKVTCNEVQLANITNQSSCAIEFVAPSSDIVIKLKNNLGEYTYTAVPRLIIGTPSVLDCIAETKAIDVYTENTAKCHYTYRRNGSVTTIACTSDSASCNAWTDKFDTLSKSVGITAEGFGHAIVSGQMKQVSARLDGDGSLYINEPQNSTLNNLVLVLVPRN